MLDDCTISRADTLDSKNHTLDIIYSNNTNTNTNTKTKTKTGFLCLPVVSISTKKKMSLKFPNEIELTKWMIMMMCINRSYLINRKTNSIRIINESLRTVWLNARNKYDETALHTIAKQRGDETGQFADFILRQVDQY